MTADMGIAAAEQQQIAEWTQEKFLRYQWTQRSATLLMERIA